MVLPGAVVCGLWVPGRASSSRLSSSPPCRGCGGLGGGSAAAWGPPWGPAVRPVAAAEAVGRQQGSSRTRGAATLRGSRRRAPWTLPARPPRPLQPRGPCGHESTPPQQGSQLGALRGPASQGSSPPQLGSLGSGTFQRLRLRHRLEDLREDEAPPLRRGVLEPSWAPTFSGGWGSAESSKSVSLPLPLVNDGRTCGFCKV